MNAFVYIWAPRPLGLCSYALLLAIPPMTVRRAAACETSSTARGERLTRIVLCISISRISLGAQVRETGTGCQINCPTLSLSSLSRYLRSPWLAPYLSLALALPVPRIASLCAESARSHLPEMPSYTNAERDHAHSPPTAAGPSPPAPGILDSGKIWVAPAQAADSATRGRSSSSPCDSACASEYRSTVVASVRRRARRSHFSIS